MLQTLLGLKSEPVIVNGVDSGMDGITSKRTSSMGLSKNAQSAWHKAEVGVESDDEHPLARHRHVAEDEDEGRYSVGRRPARKYQKTERPQNHHAVFTTDDDDEYERISAGVESADSLDDEEAHYASDGISGSRGSATGKAEKRRSFWLSKAINIGGSLDDD